MHNNQFARPVSEKADSQNKTIVKNPIINFKEIFYDSLFCYFDHDILTHWHTCVTLRRFEAT